MAIIEDHIYEITVAGGSPGVGQMNVMHYHADSGSVTATGEDLANAWWQNVKGWWRSVAATNFVDMFKLVTARDITDLAGAYGTFGIPLVEQGGTRAPGASPEGLPDFVAAGVRLNVGTRLTRPGQKRLAGLNENDQFSSILTAGVLSVVQAWGDQAIQTLTLGEPAPLLVITPVVVHKLPDGSAGVYQPMTSATAAANVTSQVSRKRGRGF